MSDVSSISSIADSARFVSSIHYSSRRFEDKPPSILNPIPVPLITEPATRFSQKFSQVPGRAVYFKTIFAGCFIISLVIFGTFSIYWGANWQIPAFQLEGRILDLDGGIVGETVTSAFYEYNERLGPVRWTALPNGTTNDIIDMVQNERSWLVVVINAGATRALDTATAGYDPQSAITVYASEARNENAFRALIRPSTESVLLSVGAAFAETRLGNFTSEEMETLATTSPQALLRPISYQINNLAPFDIPVATAIDFVGLIFLLILSFFMVMIGAAARDGAGLETRLTTMALIQTRLASIFGVYFIITLFYSLLSLAFQVDFTRTYGRAGFLLFWATSYMGMLSVGLLLEAMLPLLTPRFMPFLLIFWVIVNISVASMPLDVLPHIFSYGYAMPFYNISCIARSILFGTSKQLGLRFGILIAWISLGTILLAVLQCRQRRLVLQRGVA